MKMPIQEMKDKKEVDKERLKELAFIDDLTSLYNRRYLYQYLPTELRAIKRAGKQLCLFMMDVDNFKEINDTYGHLCGDKILMEIAEILHKSLRTEDTIVRYAGDEFVAILPGTKEDVAINIGKRMIENVSKNTFKEDDGKFSIHLTLSIGLALSPRDAQDPEKLIFQADMALYSSKRNGRNRISTIKDISMEMLDEARLKEIFPCAQLIGRQSQMETLKELLDKAEKGESKFALIKGERGIGKTRIISEFKKHAQLKGITNISASCSPEISEQPYQILIIALQNLFAALGSEVREFIRSLPEAQTAQLANYIPTLKQFLPKDFKAVKIASPEQAQIDLFKGICQSLIYVVKRNTFLLIIDDFHWIDKGTLKLFNYIIKDLRDISIFIVGAMREEELKKRSESSSLQSLLQEMGKNKLLVELPLEPLTKEDIIKMLAIMFHQMQVGPEFVDIIYDVSAGNPLFIEEVLRSLVNKGFIYYQDKKWQARGISEASFPPFLKEAIQKRLSELDEETKPVVAACAVMGEVFDFDILCQLLDKDPGYILEVIDRATRQHLIVPERPFQTDKFKFNSGVIRDVIYTALDAREKQNLHKKLALIEEKTYKDNIDSVAGSLGYHFSKAQDTEKASLYGNMLLEKAAHMPTYADVFNFLQESLLERVEEITVPLSDASMKLVPAMVRSLRLATQNVRLYPAQSEIRRGFVEQANKYLTDILEKDSTLIISTAENRLLINGEEITEKAHREAGASAFIALMINQRIKSITFKKNLTKEQLVSFLEALSQSYDDLIPEGGLSGILRKSDISQIRVNEVRYEQTSKLSKHRTKFEEAMLIDYLIGKVSNLGADQTEFATAVANDPKKLAAALKKVAAAAKVKKGEDRTQTQANIIAGSLQKLSEQVLSQTKGGLEQYRKNIAEAMMALDYKLRSKLVQTQVLTDKPTTSGDVIEDTIKSFPDKEILEMVAKEFSASGGSLNNLRNLIRRFLSDSQRKQNLLPKLKTKLAQIGMSAEETSWVLEEDFWPGLSLKDKTQKALKLPAKSYLELQKEVSKQIEQLVSELLENDQYSEAGEIIDKLLKQLEDESHKVRSTTLGDLADISEMLITKEKYFLLEGIINGLATRLDKEKDPQVYAALVEVLATICAKLLKQQNFIQATGILREFNLRLRKTSKLLDMQKKAVKEAKEKTIAQPALVNGLVKLLADKIDGHREFWELSKVISEIGEPFCEPLFALAISKDIYADPFKTYALRWSIAKVFKEMGDEAIVYFKQRLTQKNAQQIKVTLELLGHMQNESLVKYLHPLLKTEDFNVRREAIGTLGKIGGREAIKLLSTSIKDKDSQIRLATIWALTNIGGPEVVTLLEPLLKEQEFSGEAKRIIQRIKRM